MDSGIYGTVKNVIISDGFKNFTGRKLFVCEGSTKNEI